METKKSCKNAMKHGHTAFRRATQEYKAWSHMKSRCYNTNDKKFPRYGDRGIKVCKQWINNFQQFLADVGYKPSKDYLLDRIDNNGNYEPCNVKWSSRIESARNRNIVKTVEVIGYSYNIPEWSEISGIKGKRIWLRLNTGWPPIDAIFQPALKNIKNKYREKTTNKTVNDAVRKYINLIQQ